MKFVLTCAFAGIMAAGCAHHRPDPVKATVAPMPGIVTPANSFAGRVVASNAAGRFVVLNYPTIQLPKVGQTLFLYTGWFEGGRNPGHWSAERRQHRRRHCFRRGSGGRRSARGVKIFRDSVLQPRRFFREWPDCFRQRSFLVGHVEVEIDAAQWPRLVALA